MSRHLSELRIVFIYFIFASGWILFSDFVLEFFIKDMNTLASWQTYKGLFFITITSTILFFLIKTHTSKLYKVQKELEGTKQRLELVIQGANLGYWDWNYETNSQIVNDTWLSFLGLQRDDIANSIIDWSARIHPDDIAITTNAIAQTIEDFIPYVIEFRMLHKDGHWVWIEGSGAVVSVDAKSGKPLRLAGTHKDISNRKKAEEKISFLALNDPLTKLPNRFYLKDKLESLIHSQKDIKFAFLFLDLDYFKNVNDLYGHSEGDKVIQEVAERFKNSMNTSDFIARAGGDEFVILKQNIDTIEEECKKLIQVLEKPFIIKGLEIHLGISIGISLFPKDGTNFEELFKNSDIAMYVAKENGKNRYEMYQTKMTDSIVESVKLDNEIQKAIENDEFVVYFQPQINLNSKKVIGAEALVRWKKPNSRLVFPDAFIKKSEENRTIIKIGIIVFKKSLEQLLRWKSNNLFEGILAINISAVQLEEDDFAITIENICKEMDIQPTDIELEVTESYIMKNPQKSIKTLRNLKNLGFNISIDDFGTGYSSLSYLKQLPVDKLKIDRSFIKDLADNNEDRAISKTIISLAKNLELEVLAEGVETEVQRKFLEDNLCDSVQGYLFSVPLDSEAFYAYLKSL
ncbi:MAG: EAL domain-containing protein [Sulfurimonas sp.]|nr:EAL domain-containing protein [Sulfurimonas sp.]MBU3938018.1 EAL domain-containing protein [bacterium]MBU4024951.1 EAL domain-containing protein [bacterium]MBU4059502.1 EAL domain-containing protein [bacterium]MBU4110880.1 EAL domain-containing protein [bacterium]